MAFLECNNLRPFASLMIALSLSSTTFVSSVQGKTERPFLIANNSDPFEVDYKIKKNGKSKRAHDRSSFKLNDGFRLTDKKSQESKPVSSLKRAKPKFDLEGKAEHTDYKLKSAKDVFKAAVNEMRKTDYKEAARLFKMAGAKFGKGYETQRAEANYYEAGCLVMEGKNSKALKLYRRAWHLFKKHDPMNPYTKPILEQMCNLSVSRMKLQEKYKLDKMAPILISRNITLVGHVKDDGKRMSALLDVDQDFVDDSVHQCFVDMTCLETAEIGSNSTNALGRWLPLLAQKRTAVFSEKPDTANPVIKVKINKRFYTVNVDLPRLSSGLRTIMLVTNGEKICAIDPSTHETWLLKMKLEKNKRVSHFEWKKLTHVKPKTY